MSELPSHADHPPQGWFKTLARLWLLRPARLSPSANALRATCIMGALWLAAWVAIDRWQSQPDPQFFAGGIPLLAWYALAILGLAALLRRRSHPAAAFAPLLALCVGAVPVPLLFTGLFAADLEPAWLLGGCVVVGIYTLIYLAFGLHAVTGRSQRARQCGLWDEWTTSHDVRRQPLVWFLQPQSPAPMQTRPSDFSRRWC